MDSEVSENETTPSIRRSLVLEIIDNSPRIRNKWVEELHNKDRRERSNYHTTKHIFRTMTIVKLQMNATTDNHNSTTKNKTDPGNKRDGQKSL